MTSTISSSLCSGTGAGLLDSSIIIVSLRFLCGGGVLDLRFTSITSLRVSLLRDRRGDRERRVTTSSTPTAPDLPPRLKQVYTNHPSKSKPPTVPRTMPATVPPSGPASSPAYVVGIATTVCRLMRADAVLVGFFNELIRSEEVMAAREPSVCNAGVIVLDQE